MNKISKFFKKIFFICLIYHIKFIWNRINKYNNYLKDLSTKERKYKKFFIKDKEDLELNKDFLDTFKIKTNKYKNKLIKRELQLKIYLYKYEFFSDNFIIKCNDLNISSDLISPFRQIYSYFLKK